MEQEITSETQNQPSKVYNYRQIWVAVFLGGTLAAGFMAAANYRAFGERAKWRTTWIATIAATGLIFFASYFAPYADRIHPFFFTLVIAGIVVILVQMFQGEQVRRYLLLGGRIEGWWKAIGVAIGGLAATLLLRRVLPS